jgi:tetratricopeptide (TPR) repeat protein
LNWAGIFTAGSGDYEIGLEFYHRGLAYALAEQDSLGIPRHMANIARRHRLLGNLDSCRVYLEEAERWIDTHPDPGNRAIFLLYQAEYYAQVGGFTTVDSLLAVASNLQSDFSPIEAFAELHLQLIEQGMERGRPGQAYRSIALLDPLRDRLQTASADRNELFDLLLDSAEFLARQGLFARAVESLDRADMILERRPDPDRRWKLFRARGDLARRRNDPEAAEAVYRACLAMSDERRDAGRLAESRLLPGSVLLDRGRFSAVRELWTHRPDEAFGGRFRTRLSTTLLGAAAESRAGRFREALHTLESARSPSKPSSPPDLLARLDLETGRAEAGLGHHDGAREAYLRAMERLQRERRRSTDC